jgi:hypothetical protein
MIAFFFYSLITTKLPEEIRRASVQIFSICRLCRLIYNHICIYIHVYHELQVGSFFTESALGNNTKAGPDPAILKGGGPNPGQRGFQLCSHSNALIVQKSGVPIPGTLPLDPPLQGQKKRKELNMHLKRKQNNYKSFWFKINKELTLIFYFKCHSSRFLIRQNYYCF